MMGTVMWWLLLGALSTPAATLQEAEEIRRARAAAIEAPEDADAAAELGRVLQAYERYGEAEVQYQRAHSLAPQRFDWLYLLAEVRRRLGKTEEAIHGFARALEVDPGYLPGRVRLADALLEGGRIEESERQYREALAARPGDPLALYGLGRALALQGKTREALEPLASACRIFPEFGAAHYALALAHRDLGNGERARLHLERYRSHPNRWPARGDRLLDSLAGLKGGAQTRLARGVELAEEGRLDEAVREHLAALQAAPSLAQAHVNLISLQARLGRDEEAEHHYREAVKLQPGLAEAHYDFGVLSSSRGRLAEAEQAFERALGINPHHPQAHNNLGAVLERLGRAEEAARHYREAVTADPTYRTARFNLGRTLLALGRIEEAAAELSRTLLPEDQDTPRYLYALAAANIRLGNLAKALEHTRRARRLALQYRQTDLLEQLNRDLAKLEKALQRP